MYISVLKDKLTDWEVNRTAETKKKKWTSEECFLFIRYLPINMNPAFR